MYKLARGHSWMLLFLLCLFSGVVSAFIVSIQLVTVDRCVTLSLYLFTGQCHDHTAAHPSINKVCNISLTALLEYLYLLTALLESILIPKLTDCTIREYLT